MIDECHATGFLGKTGRGTHRYRNVMGHIDIITGTFGKALEEQAVVLLPQKEIIEILRQRSRPYLFSNTLAPIDYRASIRVLDLLSSTTKLRDKLERNTRYFRTKTTQAGFDILPGEHPIVPIMLYMKHLGTEFFASKLLDHGIYVIGFFFPVVPKGKARIRVQISAGHETEHLDQTIDTFTNVGKELGIEISWKRWLFLNIIFTKVQWNTIHAISESGWFEGHHQTYDPDGLHTSCTVYFLPWSYQRCIF